MTALKPKQQSPLLYSSLLRIGGGGPPPTTVAYLSTNIPVYLYSSRLRRPLSPVYSYGGGSAPQRRSPVFIVYFLCPSLLRRLCLGLFYTVIGWPEFGDITTDGSHYGLDISRTGLQLLLYGLISTL